MFIKYLRFLFLCVLYIEITNEANIIPDTDHPTQLTFHANHTVTFENGTNTNETFYVKRTSTPREYEGLNITLEPRGLMM